MRGGPRTAARPHWCDQRLALVQLVDGRRTIHEIVAAAMGPLRAGRTAADLGAFARTLFTSLVNRDFSRVRPAATTVGTATRRSAVGPGAAVGRGRTRTGGLRYAAGTARGARRPAVAAVATDRD